MVQSSVMESSRMKLKRKKKYVRMNFILISNWISYILLTLVFCIILSCGNTETDSKYTANAHRMRTTSPWCVWGLTSRARIAQGTAYIYKKDNEDAYCSSVLSQMRLGWGRIHAYSIQEYDNKRPIIDLNNMINVHITYHIIQGEVV